MKLKQFLPHPGVIFFAALIVFFSWYSWGTPIPSNFPFAAFANRFPLIQSLYGVIAVVVILAMILGIVLIGAAYDEWRKR